MRQHVWRYEIQKTTNIDLIKFRTCAKSFDRIKEILSERVGTGNFDAVKTVREMSICDEPRARSNTF